MFDAVLSSSSSSSFFNVWWISVGLFDRSVYMKFWSCDDDDDDDDKSNTQNQIQKYVHTREFFCIKNIMIDWRNVNKWRIQYVRTYIDQDD